MRKIFFYILLIVLIVQSNFYSQIKCSRSEFTSLDSLCDKRFSSEEIKMNSSEQNLRTVFIGGGIGIFEVVTAHIGYQINRSFSFAIKGSGTWIGSGLYLPNSGTGIGFQINYAGKFFFNSLSFGYLTYLDITLDPKGNSLTKGNFFNLYIGKENIEDFGINFYWSIGLCLSDAKASHTVIFPSLNAGLNFNI